MKTTVAILEPHPQIRPQLSHLLTTMGYEVIFQAERFSEFVLHFTDPEKLPQVCIIDTNHRDMAGFDHSRWVKAHFPGIKTIIYSNDLSESVYHRFQNTDVADYYVDKNSGLDLLSRTIEFCTRAILPVTKNVDHSP